MDRDSPVLRHQRRQVNHVGGLIADVLDEESIEAGTPRRRRRSGSRGWRERLRRDLRVGPGPQLPPGRVLHLLGKRTSRAGLSPVQRAYSGGLGWHVCTVWTPYRGRSRTAGRNAGGRVREPERSARGRRRFDDHIVPGQEALARPLTAVYDGEWSLPVQSVAASALPSLSSCHSSSNTRSAPHAWAAVYAKRRC